MDFVMQVFAIDRYFDPHRLTPKNFPSSYQEGKALACSEISSQT
jgi:hypothetical protein